MRRCALILLALSACGEDDDRGLVRVPVSGVFQPASLDFGDVPVNGSKSMRATLVNTGEITLGELTPIVPDDRFTLTMEGAVPPGARGEVIVSFAPISAGAISAKLALQPAGEDPIELDVRANGVLAPILTVDPASIDFGVLPLGEAASRKLTVSNRGSAPGWIASADVPAPFALSAAPPFSIAEASTLELQVLFRPTTSGEQSGVLAFDTNALEPVVTVGLSGQVEVGALVCTPDRIDFGAVLRGMSSAISLGCVSTGSIRFTGAELIGSNVFSIDAPDPIDLGQDASIPISVAFASSGPQSEHQATIVLHYRNAEGDRTTEVPVIARVLAPEPSATAISIFLFWDTELSDMDLHLVRPGGAPFDDGGSDCYFQRPTADWGTSGDMSDDPFLDRDDFDGTGPENINVANAEPGSYEVYVHYYADNRAGASTASLEIHGGGSTLGLFERSLACDDLWHAGTLVWDGTVATVVPSTEVSPAGRGLCF